MVVSAKKTQLWDRNIWIERDLSYTLYIAVIIITVHTVALSSCMAIATAYNYNNNYYIVNIMVALKLKEQL